jgi:hypothetical protein
MDENNPSLSLVREKWEQSSPGHRCSRVSYDGQKCQCGAVDECSAELVCDLAIDLSLWRTARGELTPTFPLPSVATEGRLTFHSMLLPIFPSMRCSHDHPRIPGSGSFSSDYAKRAETTTAAHAGFV